MIPRCSNSQDDHLFTTSLCGEGQNDPGECCYLPVTISSQNGVSTTIKDHLHEDMDCVSLRTEECLCYSSYTPDISVATNRPGMTIAFEDTPFPFLIAPHQSSTYGPSPACYVRTTTVVQQDTIPHNSTETESRPNSRMDRFFILMFLPLAPRFSILGSKVLHPTLNLPPVCSTLPFDQLRSRSAGSMQLMRLGGNRHLMVTSQPTALPPPPPMRLQYNYALLALLVGGVAWVAVQPQEAFKKDGFAGLFDGTDDDDEDDDDDDDDESRRASPLRAGASATNSESSSEAFDNKSGIAKGKR